jgi:protein TonB
VAIVFLDFKLFTRCVTEGKMHLVILSVAHECLRFKSIPTRMKYLLPLLLLLISCGGVTNSKQNESIPTDNDILNSFSSDDEEEAAEEIMEESQPEPTLTDKYSQLMTYVFEQGSRVDDGSKSGLVVGRSAFNWGYAANGAGYGTSLGVTYSLMGSQATESGKIEDLKLDDSSCGFQECSGYLHFSLRGNWKNNDPTTGSGTYIVAFSASKPQIEFYIFGEGNWQHWNTYEFDTTYPEFLYNLYELEIIDEDALDLYLGLEGEGVAAEDLAVSETQETLSSSDFEEETFTEADIIRTESIQEAEEAREQLKTNNAVEEEDDIDVPFAVIEEVPVFPGCESASDKRACFNEKMQDHIRMNFQYPQIAYEMGIQGRVSVLFTIQKDGSIGNIRMRGPDRNLEAEAQRIISLLPRMTPGRQRGKTVRVPFSIPITFKLQ